MKFAIDRDAMLDTILNGHGYVGNDHPIAKSQRFYAKDLPQRSYDPDKAKFHLKKAGLSKFDVTLAAGDIYAGGVDAATLFKEHAAKANININVDRVSTDGYWSNVWNTVPFCVSYWSGRPTEDLMLSLAFSNKSSWNETHWNNDRFEELLVSARAELDEIKRQDMYSEMQRLISDEGGLIAPVFANTIDVLSDKLGTPEEISSNMAVDGQRNTERWWFK
jgi:peptide/nickel transport system substrate-binding protein